jgi:hypothetical protein
VNGAPKELPNYYLAGGPAFCEGNDNIVGDSFVQGLHCANDRKDLPSHVQKTLGDDTLVVNLGVGGKNPADYIDWMSNAKIGSKDEVIIVLYDNDIHVTEENCGQIMRQAIEWDLYVPKSCQIDNRMFVSKDNNSILKRINNSVKGLKVVQVAKEGLVNMEMFSAFFYRNEYIARWNDFEAEETKWIISAVSVLAEIIEGKGARSHFMYYPNTNSISETDPRHAVWKNFIANVNADNGVEIKDPYPFLIQEAVQSSMVWSLTDKHPSCAAHKLMSDYVTSEIISLTN